MDWLVGWSIGRLNNLMVTFYNECCVGCGVGWFSDIDPRVGGLDGWLVAWLVV